MKQFLLTLAGVFAGLMLFFMLAIARIPLGTASALEFLGPLAVSIFGPGQGRILWAVLAAAGVVLLTQPWHGGVDPVGVGAAIAAAACWGCYILLTQHVGDRVTGLSGLAVSMPVAGAFAAVVVLVVSGPSEVDQITWPVLFIMLGLAVLHPVVTFTLEYLSLRRLAAKAFGTLMSLEPAVAQHVRHRRQHQALRVEVGLELARQVVEHARRLAHLARAAILVQLRRRRLPMKDLTAATPDRPGCPQRGGELCGTGRDGWPPWP